MPRKLVLNYPVFDGVRVNEAATVVIENGKISRETVLEQGEASSDFFKHSPNLGGRNAHSLKNNKR